jgi:hypothetical protein
VGRPRRLLVAFIACAVPVLLWLDRGALFAVVALLSFTPMLLFAALAREWPPRRRAPGPLDALLVVPLTFVAAGLITEWRPLTCLLLGVALYVPLVLIGLARHPARATRRPAAR